MDSADSGRETRIGQSIAQRSRRSQRGIGIVAERLSVDTGAFRRETREKENIGNQRPIAIEELTKRKAARIKRRAGVRKPGFGKCGSGRDSSAFARSSNGSGGVQKNVSTPTPVPLRDLCAMLFPFAARSHTEPTVSAAATLEFG